MSNNANNGFSIGKRRVGGDAPAFVIAELSGNHNQSFEKAKDLVKAAADCGVDAVKIQTYTADTLTIDCDKPPFQIKSGTLWDGKTLHALYREAYTPWEWQPALMRLAEDLGLICFSTPFDATAVDFLEELRVPAHKVASFELVDLPLLKKVGATKKPVIMSTGMATLEEIDESLGVLRASGANDVALLACSSAYPSPPEAINLRRIPHLREKFDVVAGLSDHTMGISVPVAAVALGASIIEKHFCLSRNDPGPDSAFSLEPAEMRALVDAVRVAEKALGAVRYGGDAAEEKSRVFRRSLFIVKDVKRGETLTREHVRSIRPGFGLHTRHLEELIGKRASRDIERGTPMSWDLVEKETQR